MNKNIHAQKDLNDPESIKNDSSLYVCHVGLAYMCFYKFWNLGSKRELENTEDLPLKW